LSRVRFVATLTTLLLVTPLVFAQLDNTKPFSGGVLAARAFRAGKLVPQGGGTLQNPPGLTCSPAPCVLTPTRASEGGQPANENPVAVNPRNPQQLLSGANDYNCSNIQGWYASSDGGATWNHTCSPGSGGEGDPIVGYDLNNRAYAGGIQNGNIILSSSTDNGAHWGSPIKVTGPLLGYLADKPWLEVDTTPGSPNQNALYISTTQFASNSDSEIAVSRSTDGGATWKTVAVDTRQTFPAVDQFSDLAVGADGTVYVSWQRCVANGPSGDCGGTTATYVLSKSNDGGATWSSPVTIGTATLTPDPQFCCFYGALPVTNFERVSNIPSVAAFGSGLSAKVYASFYNWTGSQMQVLVATSIDGGNTFSSPVRVTNSNNGDEFFQWVNVNRSGRVSVTWLDRRNDPQNVQYQPFAALGTPTGFGPSSPLTSSLSNPNNDGFGGFFMGDYRTHVWAGGGPGQNAFIDAVWMDTTTGTNNCQDEFGGVRVQ
jgi:hypothetical protein